MSDWSDDEAPPPAPVLKRAIGRGRGRPTNQESISDPNANNLKRDVNNSVVSKSTTGAGDKSVKPVNTCQKPAAEQQDGVEQDNEMMVPKHLVGRIIGKGGSNIRQLREASGARIDITDEGFESRILLTGTPDQVAKAKELISQTVEDLRTGLRPSKQDTDPMKCADENSGPQGIPSYWGTGEESGSEDEFGPPEDEPPIDWDAIRANMVESENKRWAHLPPIVKNLYNEKDCVKQRTIEEVTRYRDLNNCIQVKNFNPEDKTPLMNPVFSFEEAFSEYPDIMATIRTQGFEKPSPIQSQIWPYLLSGRDTIGIAQTGTGKTLGFLLPAFIHIEAQPTPRSKRDGASVLIFAPTRELAQQISNEVKKYEYHGIRSVCVYGGGSIGEQLRAIEAGVEIIIATPGRFNHFVEKGSINLSSITYLVLDEADRMLDQGFEYEIRKTLVDIRPDRLTVMTSATWPPDVRRLAEKYMVNPATVFVGSLDLAAVHSVTQEIVQIEDEEKKNHLVKFIKNMGADDKVIVFAGRKARVSELAVDLVLDGIDCQSIHGDREQEDREQALQDLKSGSVKILIATDVASRGIDINDITHVLNFDFPKDMEEYVHRIGRTGRAGRTGTSISLFTKQDWRKSPELVNILEEANQEVPEWLRRESIRFKAWKEKRAADDRAYGGRSGGGRGGGGRSGGGGSGCHKCGEQGHFARECPSGGGRSGGGGSGCHKCGEQGHFARECPSGGGSGGGRRGGGGRR